MARLWHQLTEELLDFVKLPDNCRGDNFQQLYERFVMQMSRRMNPLSLALITKFVANSYCPEPPYNAEGLERAIRLLAELRDRTDGDMTEPARCLAALEVASLEMKRANGAFARSVLDEWQPAITRMEGAGVDPVVPATFHRVAYEYHAEAGPASKYYEHALLFLVHTPKEELGTAQRRVLARDLILAALVAEGVHDFGVLVAHPIMEELEGTQYEWLRALLRTFQHGDIDAFNATIAEHRSALEQFQALQDGMDVVKEKITLVAIMELVASKPPHERSVAFAEFAEVTRLPLDQIEWILMRAMSLGLLEGVLDEVDGVAHISFVKPRVLNMDQVRDLREKVQTWEHKVHHTLVSLEGQSHDLFA